MLEDKLLGTVPCVSRSEEVSIFLELFDGYACKVYDDLDFYDICFYSRVVNFLINVGAIHLKQLLQYEVVNGVTPPLEEKNKVSWCLAKMISQTRNRKNALASLHSDQLVPSQDDQPDKKQKKCVGIVIEAFFFYW
ncbi:hypothetical protein FRX31_016947 [Thalictrum thalictroides]|uniref:Uncharacterized protein n=1 Tax=Thalictrum thalictroides TaxID=46969 RepID=A0A7J6W970_THATH|nr:hypothetical protein FRX31_016947 [Thalictrum thalictroides]